MALEIHHLNCLTMCPPGRRLLRGEGGWTEPAEVVCHCLLVETGRGLVLVETGVGLGAVNGTLRLPGYFRTLMRPRLREEATAVRQIEAMGYDASDVRHVLVTHLDVDHAGGLPDFPDARVHLYDAEHHAGVVSTSIRDRLRYKRNFWRHEPRWAVASLGGDRWYGFDAVRAVPGLEDEILLVPLEGHTPGHSAIAVRGEDGWILHCGDAYFDHREVDVDTPRCPPGLALFQAVLRSDVEKQRSNQARLRELKREHGDEVRVICAHDPKELGAFRA